MTNGNDYFSHCKTFTIKVVEISIVSRDVCGRVVYVKAKESWEMDPPEKLEQSEISKNKGTDYFKVRYLLLH